MGKEWDRLGDIGKTSHQGIDPEPGFKGFRLPAFNGSANKKCNACGKWAWDYPDRKCECESPDFPNVKAHQARLMGEWHERWAREAYRVLKPGGHLVAFGGSRTHHRLMVAIEDAGFEIRDCLMWLYGSGFPKSLDVGKALDKVAGVEREVLGRRIRLGDATDYDTTRSGGTWNGHTGLIDTGDITAPATDLARQWDGWGTALKPAYEPIVLARKPLIGSVAANVARYGTGSINVDATRIGYQSDADRAESEGKNQHTQYKNPSSNRDSYSGDYPPRIDYDGSKGRWPANVILDEEAAALLDAQSGDVRSSGHINRSDAQVVRGNLQFINGAGKGFAIPGVNTYGDTGGASRFFYCAKSSRAERNKGLDGMPLSENGQQYGTIQNTPNPHHQNVHPTVKPLALMQWLVRLVTPPGGTVLDPFGGSGSTMIAADREGFHGIYIDLDPEYVEIARRRIYGDAPLFVDVAAD
jgi:hypothetical protein